MQNFIHFTFGRNQTDFLESLNRVIFRLPLPHTLSFHRTGILGGLALVAHCLRRIHLNLREFLVAPEVLQVVAPEPCLRLELQPVLRLVLNI